MTSDLHLTVVVNSVLVSSKVVGPREYRIARLPGAGVDALTLVRTGLRVTLRDSLGMRRRMLPVTLTLVLLQLLGRLKP